MTIVAQTPPAGQDASPAIQAAIDQALAAGTGLVIPRGTHTCLSPVRAFLTGAQHWISTLSIAGEEMAYGTRTPATTLLFPAIDAPGLVLQCARAVRLRDLAIQGAYAPPVNGLASLLDQLTFAVGAYRNNRRSPHCGIVVDALHPSVAQQDRYPALAAYYDQPGEVAGSSDVEFDRVTIDGFICGLGVSVSGYTQNAENFSSRRMNVSRCRSAIAFCQPQSRACVWRESAFGYVDTIFDGVQYGEQSGKEPHIEGANIVWCRRIFDTLAAGEATRVEGLRGETFFDFGIVRSSTSTPMEIEASTFAFAGTPAGTPRPPLRIANVGRLLSFRGGGLGIAATVPEAIHAWTTSRVTFDNCGIAPSGWAAVQAPLLWCSANPWRAEYRNSRMTELRGAIQSAAALDPIVREEIASNLSGSMALPAARAVTGANESVAPLYYYADDMLYRGVTVDGIGGADVDGAVPSWTPPLAPGDLIYSLTNAAVPGLGQSPRLVLGEVLTTTPTIKLRHVHGFATNGQHRLYRVRFPRWP